jgi:hypothetical protein
MAQFQSPETYVDGQQVTATRLNNQTNGAIALPGLITDQTNITANTVASGDSVLLYDLSATALREANVSDVLGSNVPVTTSAVTGGANSDIVLTPNDGAIVTGQAYTSGDGLTVTVTSTAHGLVVGQVILITAAATGYNGTFRVATVATNSFTYVMTTAATPGSSTLSYTKKGTIRNAGNESVAGSLFVAGSAVISGAAALTGATTISGAATVSGATTVSGALTSSGTANFTGTLQYKSTPIFGLYAVQVNPISALASAGSGSTATVYSSLNTNVRGAGGTDWWLTQGHTHYSETIVVPSGELWTVEYSPIEIARDSDDNINFVCLKDGVPFAGTNINTPILQYSHFTTHAFYTLSSGTHLFLWKSVIINGSGGDVIYVDVFGNCTRKIHKYKTA